MSHNCTSEQFCPRNNVSQVVLLSLMPLVGSMCPELPGRALQLQEGRTYAEEEEEAEGENEFGI